MAWTLRKASDHQLFENQSLEQIEEWAFSAQVNPYDELSEDGETWTHAWEMPQFEMVWTTTLVDGSVYGPANVATLREFVDAELLSTESIATHRLTGKRMPVRDLIQPRVAAASDSAAPPPSEDTALPSNSEASASSSHAVAMAADDEPSTPVSAAPVDSGETNLLGLVASPEPEPALSAAPSSEIGAAAKPPLPVATKLPPPPDGSLSRPSSEAKKQRTDRISPVRARANNELPSCKEILAELVAKIPKYAGFRAAPTLPTQNEPLRDPPTLPPEPPEGTVFPRFY